jgi:hypothetical protein
MAGTRPLSEKAYWHSGTQTIFEEIFRRDKHLPTRGSVGKELWDLLFQAGHRDQEFMEVVVT